MKAKCIAFFPSSRNSLEANINLIDQIKCRNVVLDPTSDQACQVQELVRHRPMRVANLHPLDVLIRDRSEDGIAKVPFDVSPTDAHTLPCLVLHTSGSTGTPKAATLTHTWFTAMDALHDLATYGADVDPFATHHWEHTRFFMPFPNCHCASLLYNLAHTIYFDMTVVAVPVNTAITSSLVRSYFLEVDIETGILSPGMLKEIVSDEAALESLGKLKSLGYGGAPMASEVGNRVAEKVHLVNLIGPTETGMLPVQAILGADWDHFKYSESTGLRFDPVTEDEYEMVIVRDPRVSPLHAIFSTYPDIDEYRTKDLYSPHPTKPGLWLYRGRTDDIIIFSNNLNFNPLKVEQDISAHPAVSALLLVGDSHPTAVFLIEPAVPLPNGEQAEGHKQQLTEELWPLVRDTCAQSGIPVNVFPDMIIITSPNKPFCRAGKGSVQRGPSRQLYQDELQHTFTRFEEATRGRYW